MRRRIAESHSDILNERRGCKVPLYSILVLYNFMKLRIEEKIFEAFPELMIGVVVAKGVNNVDRVEEVGVLTREQEKRIRAEYVGETLSQTPKINVWRVAYKMFGVKPHDAKSPVENLYRLILRGEELKQINPLVDLYNYISIKYTLPVGGEDLDVIQGDLQLVYAGANEPVVKLLGDAEPAAPLAGEIMYRDDVSAICRRWNWREVERTKLTDKTKNAVIVIESLAPTTRAELESAVAELQNLVHRCCGGEVIGAIIDKNKTALEI